MTRRARRAGLGAAVLVTTALGFPGVPAHAQSPHPTHVAVVVDYDGAVSTQCVTAGDDGLTTLVHAYRNTVIGTQGPYAGFVFTIDGHGTTRPDNDHYWSYWHDTGHGWTYANTGGAGYHPPAGSLEGWSYVDGSAHAAPPPTVSYASVCAGQDPRPSTPAPTPRHTSATHSTATSPAARASTAAVASKSAHRTPSRRNSVTPSRTTTPSVGQSVVATSLAAAPSPSSSPAALTHSGSSATPAVGTAVALVVVLGLGGAALWRHRRQA